MNSRNEKTNRPIISIPVALLIGASFLVTHAICFVGLAPAQDKKAPAKSKRQSVTGAIQLEAGALQDAKNELKKIFKLRWEDDKLRLDQESWKLSVGKSRGRNFMVTYVQRLGLPKEYESLATLFQGVTAKLGQRGMSGGSSGNSAHQTFSSGSAQGGLYLSRNDVRIQITEQEKPGRSFSFRTTKDGAFSFVISGGLSFLVIDQVKDGRVRVVFEGSQGTKVLSGKSFRDIVMNNGKLLAEELQPIVEHYGIQLPMLPHELTIKKSVMSRLLSLDGLDVEKFERLCEQLGDKEFDTREKSTRELSENYDYFLPLINIKLGEEGVPVEVRMRLKRIIKSNSQSNQIAEVIRSFELLDSPQYLLSLIEDKKVGANDKQAANEVVFKRLRKVTKKEFGNNVADWQKWLDEQAKQRVEPPK